MGDLDFAVRGGRVPKWVKLLADSMRMTPVIATTPNGEIKLATCLFGRRNIAARFAKYVARQTDHGAATIVGIGHAVSADETECRCGNGQGQVAGNSPHRDRRIWAPRWACMADRAPC